MATTNVPWEDSRKFSPKPPTGSSAWLTTPPATSPARICRMSQGADRFRVVEPAPTSPIQTFRRAQAVARPRTGNWRPETRLTAGNPTAPTDPMRPITCYFLDSFAAFLGDSFLGFLVSLFWLLLPLAMIASWCSPALCG